MGRRLGTSRGPDAGREPRALVRQRWWFVGAWALLATLAALAVPILRARPVSFLPLLVMPALWAAQVARRRAVLLRAARARGVACPHCVYDLRDSDESRPCPECGHPYYADDLPERWARAAGCDLWEIQWPEYSPRFARRIGTPRQ